MTLARVVVEAFAAGAEDIAAKQRQRLGQFGVFLLQLAVVGRGLVEHAFEFIDAASGVFGLPLSVFGLPPQLVVAAKQVVEQPLALLRIVGETWDDAHNMNYRRVFMLFKSIGADFLPFLGIQPACRNRLRWRALFRSIPERIMASCAGWSSMPSRSAVRGISKVPASSRLYQMARPSRSK